MMQRTKFTLAFCMVVSLITMALMSPALTWAATTPQCGTWKVSPTPKPKSTNNSFSGVAAISSNDVWAVGDRSPKPLAEHWNGTQWSEVKTPVPGTNGAQLSSVAGLTADDIWAVGTYEDSNFVIHTFIIHWNGKQWSQVSSPDPGVYENILNSVAAYASNDVWAVGYYWSGNLQQTLIEHWDGTSWSVVKSPNISKSDNILSAVSADSATDAWAVGYLHSSQADTQLIEHWNGSQWSVVSSPNPSNVNLLAGVDALSQNSAWAVGYNIVNGDYQTLTEQWNGTNWNIVTSPNEGLDNNALFGVTHVLGSSTLWAVGYYSDNLGNIQALSEQWNGSQWSIVPTSIQGFYYSSFHEISASDASHVWAVGNYSPGSNSSYPLAEVYC